MKALKKTICFFLILILGLSMFAGCSKSELTTIRLNEVVRSIFYAPHYIAISKGFFEEEGIKIELTTGQGADKTMTALLAGECDIGFAGPEACIYVYNQGKEDHAVIFAQLTKCDGSFLVAREPDPNFDWKKTAGKTIIGGRPGGVPEMTLEYILKKNGVIPGKDVEIITNLQFTATAGAFKGGTGDYVALFEPTASMLEKENAGSIVASLGKDSGLISYTAYFAKKSYIEKNPDIIQRFTNAIYKGQLWVQNNKAEDIVKEIKSFFPDADDDILITVINRYKEIDAWNTNPISIPESFELLQDIMETAGELDKRVEHSKLFDDRFAKEAVKKIK
ncbi:ABC transporter substrate-binding protein [Lutispora thermophila]|uniref:NitT/TauT family transport system substrate-binding protein n=1 Tax=Lutispora thermophila DSM 19022 TaxID=1122184 RepID=A0A1M6GLA5_9FIRM|nr:ABC transporter substrate-binding protein [Lutispora thermophila]SHJ10719.1 NitT/TauT family transport system substrate-binding protein [Lutispora thermophila DSM 19022]